MNEKIKELAAQAGMEDYPINGVNTLYGDESIEKFAELIVRECALMLDSITVPVFELCEDWDHGYNKGLETGITVIKHRFGIE